MNASPARRSAVTIIVAAAVLASAALVIASPQRLQFRASVDVVQIQVAVADSRGDHLPNLSRDDFLLRVDGRIRDLTAVYEVDLRQIQPDDGLTEEPYIPPAGWRQFLLFFDFSFSSKRGILRAREAAIEFVRSRTHPKDLVGLATYSTAGGLRLVSPFTADRDQIVAAIEGFGLNRAAHLVDPAGFALEPLQEILTMEQNRTIDPEDTRIQVLQILEATIFANIMDNERADFRRYREEVVNYAGQLEELGSMLTAARGRKHVLLFSAGFDDKVLTGQTLEELSEDTEALQQGLAFAVNSETRFGSADLRDSLDEAVKNLQAGDVVFHAFDVGGLGNGRIDDTFQTRGGGKQGLSYLADGTNGTVNWNSNDLGPALANLAEETARYYVLAYRKDANDPPVVQLNVSLTRPGAEVVAAPRRFSPPPAYADMDETQRQLQLAEYVSKAIVEEDMIFDLRAVPFAGHGSVSRLAVLIEMPFDQLRSIADARGDGSVELDILGYALDDQDRMRDMFSRRVKLDVDALGARMSGLPFRYYDLLFSAAGTREVRVLVRDLMIGGLSTRTQSVDVPGFQNASTMIVSGPVSVDAAHPGLLMRGIDPSAPPEHRAGGPVAYPFVVAGRELTPQVYTLTPVGGRCQFMLVAHHLSRHPFTGAVQTNLNVRAIDQTGAVHQLTDVSMLARDFNAQANATTMLLEAALPRSLGEGAYLLEIDLVDAITGKASEQVMPLLITADAGPN